MITRAVRRSAYGVSRRFAFTRVRVRRDVSSAGQTPAGTRRETEGARANSAGALDPFGFPALRACRGRGPRYCYCFKFRLHSHEYRLQITSVVTSVTHCRENTLLSLVRALRIRSGMIHLSPPLGALVSQSTADGRSEGSSHQFCEPTRPLTSRHALSAKQTGRR